MRNALTAMVFLSMLGFGSGAATQQDEKTAGQMCLLKVTGMHCGACASTVERVAKKIDGVTAAKASQPKGTAEIVYDPAKTTPEDIAKIITAKTPFKAQVSRPNKQN